MGKRQGLSRKPKRLAKSNLIGSIMRADRRAAPVKHVLDGAAQILEDIGGAEGASLLAVRMAHRVMHLDWLLSQDELKMARGDEIDRPQYIAAAQTWLRYATTLGIERKAKPAESLHDYMRRRTSDSSGGVSGG